MKIRRFFGKDMREALKQVKDELGGDAVIMSNKKVNGGVELVVAVDKESEIQTQATPVHRVSLADENRKSGNNTPSLRDIIGDDGPDSLKALLEKQNKSNLSDAPINNQPSTGLDRSYNLDEPQEKRQAEPRLTNDYVRTPVNKGADGFYNDAVQHSQASDLLDNDENEDGQTELNSIKEELASIRNVLQFQVSGLSEEKKRRSNPLQSYLSDKLSGMGISDELAQQLVGFVPKRIEENKAWLYTLNLLANRLQIGGNEILQQSGVVALVGPTGTGKTTTVAKLAAKYAQKYGADQVAMITIDTYRIAAFEQLATYGKIIGCAVKKAQNSEELNHYLYQLRHKKLVLIDTAGFSQRDERLISQLDDYEKDLSLQVKKYLVLPAGAQYQVLNQTISAYDNVQLNGCILSKLDECYSLGEALSVVIENDLPLNYVTDGQRVPEDIKLADAKNLTMVAAKLYKKYGLAHTTPSKLTEAVRAI
jgi:flagellar biosynthesis protein FlhF